MKKTTTKNIRMSPATSKALNVLAAQTDLPIGDLLAALVKFQGAGKYLTKQEDKDLFSRMWNQAVLFAKTSGKSGFNKMPDPDQVEIKIE